MDITPPLSLNANAGVNFSKQDSSTKFNLGANANVDLLNHLDTNVGLEVSVTNGQDTLSAGYTKNTGSGEQTIEVKLERELNNGGSIVMEGNVSDGGKKSVMFGLQMPFN